MWSSTYTAGPSSQERENLLSELEEMVKHPRVVAGFWLAITLASTPEQKNLLKKLSPAAVTATELPGDPIKAKLTRAQATTLRSAG